jgi:uncharacterized protein (TIGR02118 family)
MKNGMIKVSVFYPNGEGKTFNMDYYCNQHVALLGSLLGDAVKGATVEKGLGGGSPGAPATYAAMGNLYFESMDHFKIPLAQMPKKLWEICPTLPILNPLCKLVK